jgi:hypothetical protein
MESQDIRATIDEVLNRGASSERHIDERIRLLQSGKALHPLNSTQCWVLHMVPLAHSAPPRVKGFDLAQARESLERRSGLHAALGELGQVSPDGFVFASGRTSYLHWNVSGAFEYVSTRGRRTFDLADLRHTIAPGTPSVIGRVCIDHAAVHDERAGVLSAVLAVLSAQRITTPFILRQTSVNCTGLFCRAALQDCELRLSARAIATALHTDVACEWQHGRPLENSVRWFCSDVPCSACSLIVLRPHESEESQAGRLCHQGW